MDFSVIIDKIYDNIQEMENDFNFLEERQRFEIVVNQVCSEKYHVVKNIATRESDRFDHLGVGFSIGNIKALAKKYKEKYPYSPIYEFWIGEYGETYLTRYGIKKAIYIVEHSYGNIDICFDRYVDDEFLFVDDLYGEPYCHEGKYYCYGFNDKKIGEKIIFEK